MLDYVKEIKDFKEYLISPALDIYLKDQKTTILECTDPETNERVIIPCLFFAKPVLLENEKLPRWAIEKLANTFNYLAKEKLIDFGVMLKASEYTIADSPEGKPRSLVVLYTYPSLKLIRMAEKEEPYEISVSEINLLNKILNNKAFAYEGEMGSSNWSNL